MHNSIEKLSRGKMTTFNIKNNPLVSVVMSAYNSEKYLREAIESVLDQSYKNLEFIIVNDGSIDNTCSIIKEYMKNDNRIILIDRENKGLPYSLNESMKKAKGKKVKPYKTPPLAIVTPTGTDTGVAQMPFGVFTAKFLINLKQKDLGISNIYKMLGTVPNTQS